MVVVEFMDCMEEELKKLFDGMLFKNSSGETSKMHIFKQNFPVRKFSADEEEDDELFPYCVIRATDGTAGEYQTVDITLTFGICEREPENNGELRIMNLIERVCQRFLNDRVIGGKFRLDYDVPIKWGLPTEEENIYPYFYGLLEMTWDTFFVRREDRYV